MRGLPKKSNSIKDILECGGLPPLFCALNKVKAGACSRFDLYALKEPHGFYNRKLGFYTSRIAAEQPR